MEKYLGVKLIEAEPALKGFNLKESKNISAESLEEGYKVVYEDGYESWSPKDVFEKAYRKVNSDIPLNKGNWQPHQERVVVEAQELREKTDKLWEFVETNKIFKTLSEDEQIRLKQQSMAMQYYLTILIERIENFK